MAGQHRAPRRGWFHKSEHGNANQPDGRHTPQYVERHGPTTDAAGNPSPGRGVGMFPLGAAGRQSLAQLHADPNGDRGGRFDAR